MAGISHVLNIAKEALLAHQLSVQVAAHNVANVDTPGYTRQTLSLTTQNPSPSTVGSLGGGVRGEMITRHYDLFMTQRLMNQSSTMGHLAAQRESLRIVESVFNEAPGLALNDLLSQFWGAWQDLSDNPEIMATRQTVVQKGQLLAEQLQSMNSEIVRTRYEIGISLDTAIKDVNALSRQIAQINTAISSNESEYKKANDLRDQRDQLVKELSSLLDVNYFESSTGAYTILLADGHSLVDTSDAWQVSWQNNALYWVSTGKDGQPVKAELGSGSEIGGKIGGWLEVRGQLVEGDPNNILGRLDAFANALIREVNQQHAQGVGTVLYSGQILGAETAADTTALTAKLNTNFALDSIPAGTFTINGRSVGRINGAPRTDGLAMTKAANAVSAINEALTGVTAKLTTLTAGSAITDGLGAGQTVSFTVNGVQVDYTNDTGDDLSAADTATNVAAAIKNTLGAYNVTIEAVRGTGANGGPLNSIVLRNTTPGNESAIVIAGIDPADPEVKLGLANGTFRADASHNTGEITLFSEGPFTVKAGANDLFLTQLGMDHSNNDIKDSGDKAGDGEFTYTFADGGIPASLRGFKYQEQLQTDGGSFGIWLYNSNGTLSLPQPITVSLERASSLADVADAINAAAQKAGADPEWLKASVHDNRLAIDLANSHKLAFANDTSNFLQVAGLNTFFTGFSAGSLNVDQTMAADLRLIAAGKVGTHGEFYAGDNSNALAITNVQRNEYVSFRGGAVDTLDGFYNSLVSEVGNQGRSVNRHYEYSMLVTTQLQEMRDAVSGVSLDEEMANLIKFQHAYAAAAKLISTADEMLLTLLHSVGR
jgi:flagellar hook-associated protein FlgK